MSENKKQWYQRVTLFVILIALAIFGMLYFLIAERNSPAEVRYGFLVLLLPVILGMSVADVVLRYLIKKQLWLWVVEAFLLLATIYFWIISE